MIRYFFLIYLISLFPTYCQELNSKVIINTDKLQSSEVMIFEEMQVAIEQFLNNNIWTSDRYNSEERINCNFIINILNEPSANLYEATVQIVSSRPIYNSSYETVLLNHGDREWTFEFFPSQNLEYSQNGFNDNLTSLLAFYSYIILGIDYDSFEKLGGEENFQKAWKILNDSQNSGYKGWDQFGSKNNRYWICENFLNPKFVGVREAYYNYHLQGMDLYYSKPEDSQVIILDNLSTINEINSKNFNSSIINIFINAKANEITNIFKGASLNTKREAYNIMTELSPSNSDLFNKILE
tara:strand:+ start:1233 stop:2123 length:891 start_codon:yes stop_codon:yes gene_type:complete